MLTNGPGRVSAGSWTLEYEPGEDWEWTVSCQRLGAPGFVAAFDRYEDARFCCNARNKSWADLFQTTYTPYPMTEEEFHELT